MNYDAIAGALMRRRGLLSKTALGASALGLAATGLTASPAAAQTATLTDPDILNFALNLEYLEAQYYLRAVYGKGLPADALTGTGQQGAAHGGRQVSFSKQRHFQLAAEIAQDEYHHVLFLRSALGMAAVAQPAIDLDSSFTALARAAGFVGPHEKFDPYASELNFLIGAFVFEDVGVTAYGGALAAISDKGYLTAAGQIHAVEAYHASEIRTRLYQYDVFEQTQAIAALRASASGAADDQGLLLNDVANIVPTDSNGLSFVRTPQQVLNVVYLGGAAANYGFFPDKMNGTIS